MARASKGHEAAQGMQVASATPELQAFMRNHQYWLCLSFRCCVNAPEAQAQSVLVVSHERLQLRRCAGNLHALCCLMSFARSCHAAASLQVCLLLVTAAQSTRVPQHPTVSDAAVEPGTADGLPGGSGHGGRTGQRAAALTL
eukprot:GHRQ01034156.1.p2 GENE.GHRQ01034156.1~~GHRQ01034156.1.p2  ORF type:complete len:142 (-),score=23.02 GHRQ01034156.1:440-865(-)